MGDYKHSHFWAIRQLSYPRVTTVISLLFERLKQSGGIPSYRSAPLNSNTDWPCNANKSHWQPKCSSVMSNALLRRLFRHQEGAPPYLFSQIPSCLGYEFSQPNLSWDYSSCHSAPLPTLKSTMASMTASTFAARPASISQRPAARSRVIMCSAQKQVTSLTANIHDDTIAWLWADVRKISRAHDCLESWVDDYQRPQLSARRILEDRLRSRYASLLMVLYAFSAGHYPESIMQKCAGIRKYVRSHATDITTPDLYKMAGQAIWRIEVLWTTYEMIYTSEKLCSQEQRQQPSKMARVAAAGLAAIFIAASPAFAAETESGASLKAKL